MSSYASRVNPKGQTIVFQLRLPQELKEDLIAYCKKHDVSGSVVVRGLIENLIAEDKRKVDEK